MDDGTFELVLQHDRRLRLLNLYTTTKRPNEGHPSVHWLLEGRYSVVHDKIRTSPGIRMQNIFSRTCSCAIVCVLHVGLAALTRGTILNHTHVSRVAHVRGVYLTHELYCKQYINCSYGNLTSPFMRQVLRMSSSPRENFFGERAPIHMCISPELSATRSYIRLVV